MIKKMIMHINKTYIIQYICKQNPILKFENEK